MVTGQMKTYTLTVLYILLSSLCRSSPLYAQSLEQAASHALMNNPALNKSLNYVEEKRQQVKSARSAYFPSVDLTAGIGPEYTDSPVTRAGGPKSDKRLTRQEVAVTLQQRVFDGHTTPGNHRRALSEWESSRFQLLHEANHISMEVTRVYLRCIYAQRDLMLSRLNLETHEKISANVKKRADSGLQARADLSQIDGRLARASANVTSAENNYHDSIVAFRRWVRDSPVDLVLPVPDDNLMPLSLRSAQDQAAKNYPLLLSATQDVEAAHHQYTSLKGRYYPEVFLEAQAGWRDDLNGIKGYNNDHRVMLKVRYNLFAGGDDRARIGAAQSRWNQASDVQNNAILQVDEEVNFSWEARKALSEQLVKIKDYVLASRKTVDSYRKQFVLGDRTLLDVLNAENELFEASRTWQRLEAQKAEADFRLLHITGQLLNALRITLPEEWQSGEIANEKM